MSLSADSWNRLYKANISESLSCSMGLAWESSLFLLDDGAADEDDDAAAADDEGASGTGCACGIGKTLALFESSALLLTAVASGMVVSGLCGCLGWLLLAELAGWVHQAGQAWI